MAPVNLLIVEDDLSLQNLYKKIFTQAGYQVQVASHGQEALDRLETQHFDLILLDVMLPRLSGLDVLKTLRQSSALNQKTSVILVSNLDEPDFHKTAQEMGILGYINKANLTPRQVLDRVRSYLNNTLPLT